MYVYMRNIAPIRTTKTATVIAITEPVDTEGGELFEDDEEDAFCVELDVVGRLETEFVDEPEAPSNKLDPRSTPEETVLPPETPLAVGGTVLVAGI
jgi:hypothetical protein